MYRAEGAEALRPVGETEFVQGIAAQRASGGALSSHGGSRPSARAGSHAYHRAARAVRIMMMRWSHHRR
jgi:hypothetical protein